MSECLDKISVVDDGVVELVGVDSSLVFEGDDDNDVVENETEEAEDTEEDIDMSIRFSLSLKKFLSHLHIHPRFEKKLERAKKKPNPKKIW